MEEALRHMLVHSYISIKNSSLSVNLRIFLASIINDYWVRLVFKMGSFTSVARVSELSARSYSREGICRSVEPVCRLIYEEKRLYRHEIDES